MEIGLFETLVRPFDMGKLVYSAANKCDWWSCSYLVWGPHWLSYSWDVFFFYRQLERQKHEISRTHENTWDSCVIYSRTHEILSTVWCWEMEVHVWFEKSPGVLLESPFSQRKGSAKPCQIWGVFSTYQISSRRFENQNLQRNKQEACAIIWDLLWHFFCLSSD